ncbi:hypothetical protein FRB90_012273 [Tulasnella sp. 427]|nr:hypothetical protein FRB90_012273 [Tulasnella sp. 427]
MYLIPALVVLAAPLLTCAKYVINHTSYSAGSVQLGVSSFSNAPPSFNLFLASSRSKQLMGNVSPPGSGVLDLALPEGTTPGGYHMQIADPTTQELFSTSDKFVVKPGDLAIASSLGLSTPSLSFSSTGSVIPVLTTALITDASG